MKSFVLLAVWYLVVYVDAGGIRAALELIEIRKVQLAELRAGVAPADRIVARSCNECNFAEFLQYVNERDTVPTLPQAGDAFDRMSMAQYLTSSGIASDYPAKREPSKYDRIVKGAQNYHSVFEVLGDRARELRATTILDEVDHHLDEAERASKDVWHARRQNSLKYASRALRKEFPGIEFPTITESFSNGATYKRVDFDKFKATRPELEPRITAFMIKYAKNKVVRRHQYAIILQKEFLAKMDVKCPSLQLPQKRQPVDFNVTKSRRDVRFKY